MPNPGQNPGDFLLAGIHPAARPADALQPVITGRRSRRSPTYFKWMRKTFEPATLAIH